MKRLRYAVALLSPAWTCFAVWGEDSILLWTIDGNTTVDYDRSLYTFLSEEYPVGTAMTGDWEGFYTHEYSIRCAVKDYNGNTISYLPIAYEVGYDPTLGGVQYEFDPDMVIAGVGHPNQEPNGLYGASWTQCDVSNEMLEEYLFQIELGHEVYNEMLDDYDWTTIAKSDEVDGIWLKNQLHTYIRNDLNPPNYTPWTPGLYTIVPEPSTALLLLVGTAFLALRRRKHEHA